MPIFKFRLEHSPSGIGYAEELEDEAVALSVAKFIARHLAARNVQSGRLNLAESLLVETSAGELVGKILLADVIEVSHLSGE